MSPLEFSRRLGQALISPPPHYTCNLAGRLTGFYSTPTPARPWRGVWVGDYNVHGCEFLLINQPDVDEEGYLEPLARLPNESDEEFQARFLSRKVYRGRLEAIKLTGDPNVPRGEYTFLANDLGDDGLVGIAQGPPFHGARIVKSQGHVAAFGFASGENYFFVFN